MKKSKHMYEYNKRKEDSSMRGGWGEREREREREQVRENVSKRNNELEKQ
jgi:50S ribosomal subunit-associated GTPase HflX